MSSVKSPAVLANEILLRFADPDAVRNGKVRYQAYMASKYPFQVSVYREGRADMQLQEGKYRRATQRDEVGRAAARAGDVGVLWGVDGVEGDESGEHGLGHANIHILGRLGLGLVEHRVTLMEENLEALKQVCQGLADASWVM